MDTVRPQKEILRYSPIPSLSEIKARFSKIFKDLPLEPIIYPIAEEAEKMFFEMTTLGDHRATRSVVIFYKYYQSGGRDRGHLIRGYSCACGYSHVRAEHKYCPNCARRIEWRVPIGRKNKYLV